MGIIVAVGVFFFVNASCTTQSEGQSEQDLEGVNIRGRINYPVQKAFFIESLNQSATGFVPYDTVKLAEDNSFDHFVALTTPGFYRLNMSGRQMINVILAKDDLEIVADGNNVSGFVEINGSSELEQLKNLNAFLQQEFVNKENELNQRYGQARQAGDAEGAKAVQQEYIALSEEKEIAIMKQIEEMGASLAVVQALNYIDKDKNFEFFKKEVGILSKEYPREPNIKKLSYEVQQMQLLAIGQPAPEIELPNPDGELVKLSSLKGNVVLVDFWAEWCRPCRLENPNVVKAYNKYNPKGFEVFGVSLDRTKDKWLKAIQEDGLHWTQVSDLKYWQSEAAKTYNVSAIPMSFLLDKDGIIIAKNLRGAALDQKLEEIFSEM